MNEKEARYKNLDIWKLADDLAFDIYKTTKGFPKDESYGITSQLRRVALSVPLNIVEGYSRKGDKELARFINISLGSLAEMEYLLDFSSRLGYLGNGDYGRLKSKGSELGSKMWRFYKKLEG